MFNCIVPEDQSQSWLWCDSNGNWKGDPPSSTCICLPGHIHVGNKCVLKGPRCYTCMGARSIKECNSKTTMEQCLPDEVCGLEYIVNGALNKGCIKKKDCTTNVLNMENCLIGKENCTICCGKDYCNFPPVDNSVGNGNPVLDGTIPTCIDTQPPVFDNCSTIDQVIPLGFGRESVLVEIQWPGVTDNSGQWTIQTEPQDLGRINAFSSDTEIIFKAIDKAGLESTCAFSIIRRDMNPPKIHCSEQIIEDYFDVAENITVVPTRYPIVLVTDDSPAEVKIVFDPPNGTLVQMNQHIEVTVTATDAAGNNATCQFRYLPKPRGCPEWSLPVGFQPLGSYPCTNSPVNGTRMKICNIEFRSCPSPMHPPGPYSFYCTAGGEWREMKFPQNSGPVGKPVYAAPICTVMKTPPLIFTVQVNYTVPLQPSRSCLESYAQESKGREKNLFDSGCKNLVREAKVNSYSIHTATDVKATSNMVVITHNMNLSTSQPLPVYNVLLYCIKEFQARMIGKEIRNRIELGGCSAALYNNQSFSGVQPEDCSPGFVKDFRSGDEALDFVCLQCVEGSFSNGLRCEDCGVGTYQNLPGKTHCTPCPVGTSTAGKGRRRAQDCLAICSQGFYSENGLEPCNSCPQGMYQPDVGSSRCIPCRNGTITVGTASKAKSYCLTPCPPGSYSHTGLEPCHWCPKGYYQPQSSQTSCVPCINGQMTMKFGSISAKDCTGNIPCLDNSCKNGGTCIQTPFNFTKCQCLPGYGGPDCSISFNFCRYSPCLNNGICTVNQKGLHCNCQRGFDGKFCEHAIVNKSVCNNKTCIFGYCEIDNRGNTFCKCSTGFTGLRCNTTMQDPCSGHNCHEGTCIPGSDGNSFLCKCPSNKNGVFCETPSDYCNFKKDFCVSETTETCKNNKCVCKKGWKGVSCQLPLEDCQTKSCQNNATCVMIPYKNETTNNPELRPFCVCTGTYEGELCEKLRKSCSPDSCKNGGTCLEQHSFHQCLCPTGYYGLKCENWKNPCEDKPCQNSGICRSLSVLDYVCDCPVAFSGKNCEKRENLCNSRRNNCYEEGTKKCLPTFNGFFCHCKEGFTGARCEQQISPCDSNPCANNAHCVMGMGHDFQCNCPRGWNGTTCTNNYQCSNEVNPCSTNSTCLVVMEEKPLCLCQPGFTGPSCSSAIPHCITGLCLNGGRCVNLINGYRCRCPIGFAGDQCQINLPCIPNPCRNDGTCLTRGNHFKCECTEGYTGRQCESLAKHIDQCEIESPFTDGMKISPNCLSKEKDKVNSNYNLVFVGSLVKEMIEVDKSVSKIVLQVFTLCYWVKFRSNADSENMTYLTIFVEKTNPANNSINTSPQGYISEQLKNKNEDVFLELTGSKIIAGNKETTIPVNNGGWNHVCLKWNPEITGEWLSYLNGFPYKQSNQSTAMIRKPVAGSYTIRLGQNAFRNNKFDGALSSVYMFDTWIQDKEIQEMYISCNNWTQHMKTAAISWSDFPAPSRHDASVQRVYPSICELSTCLPGNSQCNIEKDKIPPYFKAGTCPSTQKHYSDQRLRIVNWPEPEFLDNDDVVSVTSNYRPLQVFTWGEFQVVYIAMDRAGNTAICNFRIYIIPSNCTYPPAVVNGHYESGSWSNGLFASLKCDEGYSFSHNTKPFYSCGIQGTWDSAMPNGVPFEFPACSPIVKQTTLDELTFQFSQLNCTEENLESIQNQLRKISKQLDISTAALNLDLTCSEDNSAQKRFKRDTNPAQKIPILMMAVPRLVSDTLRKYLGNNLGVIGSSRQTSTCPAGSQFVTNNCVECSLGEYFDSKTESCQKCPINYYQSKTGQFNCTKCPLYNGAQPKITILPGARSLSDCIINCSLGEKYDYKFKNCSRCQLGTYQPNHGQVYCIQCPQGESTYHNGARSINDCYFCPKGQDLNSTNFCVECPIGTYKQVRNQTSCLECPYTKTTKTTGSTSPDNCTEIWCPRGKFVDISSENGTCVPCGIAEYQPQPNKTKCIMCPSHYITVSKGSTKKSDCVKGKFNWCQLHYDKCSVHAKCTDCPDCSGKRYTCACNEGYTGDGFNCSLICNPDHSHNYCYNGGTCVPRNGQPSCDCPAGYSGEKCNIEKAASQRKKSLILGGVAGGVGFILIGLISFMVFKLKRDRGRYSIFLCCKTSLKDITTTQYYRNGGFSVDRRRENSSEEVDKEDERSSQNEVEKSVFDKMSLVDVQNEIYAGLQALQTERSIYDYFAENENPQNEDGHIVHNVPPPPVMPNPDDSYFDNESFLNSSESRLVNPDTMAMQPIPPWMEKRTWYPNQIPPTYLPRPTLSRPNVSSHVPPHPPQPPDVDSEEDEDGDYFG